MQYHVFDMDGTLLDSKAATLLAYQQAAQRLRLPVPTEETLWGHSAAEWHCPPALHAAKVEIYATLAASVQPAWAASWFADVVGKPDMWVRVWTAASPATVHVLLRNNTHAQIMLKNVGVSAGLSVDNKRAKMQGLCAVNAEIFYYDDNAEEAEYICRNLKRSITVLTVPKTEGATV